RLLRELAMEGRVRGELDRQRVAGEIRGPRLAEHGRDRDGALGDRGHDRSRPRLLQLLQLDVGSLRDGAFGWRRLALPARDATGGLLEAFQSECDRLARKVGC